MLLNLSDYKKILNFYKINYSLFNNNKIIDKAEDILANKLCRCIKKVNKPKKDKDRAVGICRHSVIRKKGLRINTFHCKKKPRLTNFSRTKRKVKKLKSRLTIKNKK